MVSKLREYNTFAMIFGWGMSPTSEYGTAKKYAAKTFVKRIDKRTKKYGMQREHNGEMNKYK